MSLKAFHILFIIVSILLCFGVGAWGLVNYFRGGPVSLIGFGIGSLVAGIALMGYGRYVLRKLRKESYL